MTALLLQAFQLQGACVLAEKWVEKNDQAVLTKAISFSVSQLFLRHAYAYFSSSPFVTETSVKLVYQTCTLLPILHLGAKWIASFLNSQGFEVTESSLSKPCERAIPYLYAAVKLHAVAHIVLKREMSQGAVFSPWVLELLMTRSQRLHPLNESAMMLWKDALYHHCLFYPFSVFYYVAEALEIAFFQKQIGSYESHLLANYLDAIKKCKNLSFNDYLTPACLAVIMEIEKIKKGEVHQDLALYPERKQKLDELVTLSSDQLLELKEIILSENRRGLLLGKLYYLTGFYTGQSGTLLDKTKNFLPHIAILQDPRVIKLFEGMA